MEKNTKFNARIYSKLGQSGSIFGLSLIDQVKNYSIKVLSADMSSPAGIDRFKTMYPDDFYNVGIAEQNLIGIAAGLASEGFKSIATAQAAFISMRSFEQVRQFMGYMQNNMIVIGISSGFALTFFGNTHYALEDLNLMRGVPNIIVLSPADAGEAVKAFEAALEINLPVYIRLTGSLNNPIVYKEDFNFKIGNANIIREGCDIALIGTGSMVHMAIKAAELLKQKEDISTTVIDMNTLKPLDTMILDKIKNHKLIVTVEEHSIIGGLGTAVLEYISENEGYPELLRLGVKDKFSSVGDYQYLLGENRLLPEQIAEDILLKYQSLK